MKQDKNHGIFAVLPITIAMLLIIAGCSTSEVASPSDKTDAPAVASPTTAPVASSPAKQVVVTIDTVEPTTGSTVAAAQLQPYPYTTPLPSPTPTELDGVYTRQVVFIGTPTPCRRCAPYRAEGGTWTLRLDKGVFRVSHDLTNFTGVGSFTLSGNQITLFNDPNCHLDIGVYRWEEDGRSLRLEMVADDCAFGLREKNLAAGSWLKQMDEEGGEIDPCQPPSLEAAISGHWPTPAECQMAQGEHR